MSTDRPRNMFKSLFLALHVIFILAAGLWFVRSRMPAEMPVAESAPGAGQAVLLAEGYGQAPAFRLLDSDGEIFSSEQLAGRPWAADFIFTRCQGICPMMNAHAKALFEEIPDFRLVSFSADPDFDTPPVLAAYAEKIGESGRTGWTFVTGEKGQLSEVSTSFHFNPVDEPMMHSGRFVLVDAGGTIRGYYDVSDPDQIEGLKRDWAALSKRP